MTKVILFAFLGMLTISFVPNQTIDETKSTISFVFESKKVEGTIGDIQSSSTIDFENFENSIIAGSVAVSTLNTGNFLRDGHLMWAKYFNKKEYPRLSFKSNSIVQKESKEYIIKGTLTIKGISKEEKLIASFSDNVLKLNGTINTTDYDITIDKKKEKNTVTIAMDIIPI